MVFFKWTYIMFYRFRQIQINRNSVVGDLLQAMDDDATLDCHICVQHVFSMSASRPLMTRACYGMR